MLCSCKEKDTTSEADKRYLAMAEMISSHDTFSRGASYYNLETDIAQIDGGYRYYVILDNPKIAMYDVEIMAFEVGTDYTKTMAACVGIFEEETYNLIPKQTNTTYNYVAGLSVSGISNNQNVTLHVLVQWKNKSGTVQYREYYELNANFIGAEK